jgi:uncharacterized membrane protein YphA (DoxX/SURF4 family)
MNELEKDYKNLKTTAKTAAVLLIITLIGVAWWEWCKEKSIRFLYTALIIGGLILYLYTQTNRYKYPDNPFFY